jgi:hypothetical protein
MYIVFGIDQPPLFIALKEECTVCSILYPFLRLFESEAYQKGLSTRFGWLWKVSSETRSSWGDGMLIENGFFAYPQPTKFGQD